MIFIQLHVSKIFVSFFLFISLAAEIKIIQPILILNCPSKFVGCKRRKIIPK